MSSNDIFDRDKQEIAGFFHAAQQKWGNNFTPTPRHRMLRQGADVSLEMDELSAQTVKHNNAPRP